MHSPQTLRVYLTNVVEHPGEEKYQRIRLGNRAFAARVASVLGAVAFLKVWCRWRS